MACIPLQGGEGVGGKNGNARVCALRLIALEDGCDRRPTAVLVWFHMFQQRVNTIQQHMPSLRANTTIHQRPLPSPQLRDDGRKVGPLCGVLRPAALHELDPGREAGEGARAWQLSEGGGVGQGRAVAAHDLAHDLRSGQRGENSFGGSQERRMATTGWGCDARRGATPSTAPQHHHGLIARRQHHPPRAKQAVPSASPSISGHFPMAASRSAAPTYRRATGEREKDEALGSEPSKLPGQVRAAGSEAVGNAPTSRTDRRAHANVLSCPHGYAESVDV